MNKHYLLFCFLFMGSVFSSDGHVNPPHMESLLSFVNNYIPSEGETVRAYDKRCVNKAFRESTTALSGFMSALGRYKSCLKEHGLDQVPDTRLAQARCYRSYTDLMGFHSVLKEAIFPSCIVYTKKQ